MPVNGEDVPITSKPPYLVELMMHLAGGVHNIPAADRQRHAQFFLSKQSDDGGFCGRDGQSDLYYTAFALRGLVLLGELKEDIAGRLADFLRLRMQGSASLIDLISLVFAARLLESASGIELFAEVQGRWAEQLSDMFESLRRPDGGYAKSAEGQASSTYQTFLNALTYELMELPLPDPRHACEFVLSQQREDGGFVEIRVMRRSGTNPTAAAIGTLRVLAPELISEELRGATSDFLFESFTDEGGFRANTQIPIADLLSTFTALQTLHDLGTGHHVERQDTMQFVNSLQSDSGGFFAAAWDEDVDVEYSFYGIGTLGLLLSFD